VSGWREEEKKKKKVSRLQPTADAKVVSKIVVRGCTAGRLAAAPNVLFAGTRSRKRKSLSISSVNISGGGRGGGGTMYKAGFNESLR
jgi:hypothetical protein